MNWNDLHKIIEQMSSKQREENVTLHSEDEKGETFMPLAFNTKIQAFEEPDFPDEDIMTHFDW